MSKCNTKSYNPDNILDENETSCLQALCKISLTIHDNYNIIIKRQQNINSLLYIKKNYYSSMENLRFIYYDQLTSSSN